MFRLISHALLATLLINLVSSNLNAAENAGDVVGRFFHDGKSQRYRATITIYRLDSSGNRTHDSGVTAISYWKDGPRDRAKAEIRTNSSEESGQVIHDTSKHETLSDGKAYVTLFLNAKTEKLSSINASFDPIRVKSGADRVGHAEFLKGHDPLFVSKMLRDIFNAGEWTENVHKEAGREIRRFENKSRWGRVIFDVDRTGRLLQMSRTKTESDLWNDSIPLGKIPKDGGGPMSRQDIVIVVHESRSFGDKILPTKYTLKETHTAQDQESESAQIDVQFHDLALDIPISEEELRPKTVIPNGEAVFVQSDPQLVYEWRDGWIQKVTDSSVDQTIASQWFRSGSGLAILSLSLVGLVILALWLVKRAHMN